MTLPYSGPPSYKKPSEDPRFKLVRHFPPPPPPPTLHQELTRSAQPYYTPVTAHSPPLTFTSLSSLIKILETFTLLRHRHRHFCRGQIGARQTILRRGPRYCKQADWRDQGLAER